MNLWQFGKIFARPLWPWYLAGTIFLALTNFITLKIPQLAKDIVNALESSQLTEQLSHLALAIIGLGIMQIIVRSLSRIMIFWPGRKIEESSKSYLFHQAMKLPQTFFDRFGMGDLVSRMSNDLGQIRVFFAFGILQALNMTFIGLFTLVMMLSIHVTLTILCLIPIAVMLILTRFVMPTLARYSRANQDAIGRLTSRVTESFANVHVLKVSAAEETFIGRAEKENQAVYDTNMKVIFFRTLFFPLLTSLTGLSQLVVLGYGGFQVIQENITIGDILAFNIYLGFLAFPLTSIGIVLSIYQRSKTALARISPIFNEPPESANAQLGIGKQFSFATRREEGEQRSSHQANEQRSRPINEVRKPELFAYKSKVSSEFSQSSALLHVAGLNYSYPTSEDKTEGTRNTILSDIKFELSQGQKIGICGAVGSGKSSLLKLIARIYDPPIGTIYWCGRDILGYELSDLRQNIGLGLQEVHLFSDSIANNLLFGLDPKPQFDDLIEATKKAQIYNEILGFEHGFETQVGEKGIRLSGGQKQRLAIARLLLRKPKLLLLDDVLSAVDNLTEAQLIKEFERSQTAILIASHRGSVLKTCDMVLLLHQGQVIDRGHYDDLAIRHPEILEEHDIGPELS